MQYPSYVFAETLRDGTAVTVRAAGANDGPKIRRAFLNLERDTVYTRFFGYKADVSDAELGRITGADFERAVALLVTICAGEDEVVIGLKRRVELVRQIERAETEWLTAAEAIESEAH